MYQKKIDSIKESATAIVSAFPEQIPFRDFLKSEIHPAVKKYVAADLRLRIFNERRFLYENSRFSYDDGVVKILLNKIDNRLEECYVFQKETLQRSVNLGIYFNASYIIRPVKTIQRLIFSTQAERSLNEIEYWLEHVYYYPFIIKGLISNLKKGGNKKADTHLFERAAHTVLSDLNEQHAQQFMTEALDSLYDFTGETDSEIEITLIKTLLEECGLQEYVSILNNLPFTYFNKLLGKSELRKLILGGGESTVMPAPEFHPDLFSVQEPEVKKITAESLFGSSSVQPEASENTVSRANSKEILRVSEESKQETEPRKDDLFLNGLYNKKKVVFEDVPKNTGSHETTEESRITDDVLPLFSGDDASQLQTPEETVQAENKFTGYQSRSDRHIESGRKRDIFTYFSEDEALKIIEVIFNGDNSDFFDTINRIEAKSSYEEALEIASLAIKRAGISESNKNAKMLTAKVKKFFEGN